ncbi:MAG: zinc-dependent metalloprotease family protein [Verrucomicrobiota bacterium]|nr:zinc-dependent metalloprotease [Limisphaera sp.]MDW8380727.1 zinc-dependent metalloprotease family protein [Verrucomicrobiota bacterium]
MKIGLRAKLQAGLLVAAVTAGVWTSAAGQPARVTPPFARREYVPGHWHQLDELPPGRFQQDLILLPARAREQVRGWLQSFHFTSEDVLSLHCDSEGGVFYRCNFPDLPERAGLTAAGAPPSASATAVPVSPFPDVLKFHSRPGAPNVLFLNFAGEVVTNTQWNTELNRNQIPVLPFSLDADFATFNEAEQAIIRAIWQRVAEDYAPFEVDVTTDRPPVLHHRVAMVLITRNTDANGFPNPASESGGVSYVNVFGTLFYSRYRPAWVYANNLGYVESYIAEAASHEAGHNLGLSHDGRSDGVEYYSGHGSGDISWAPIMGVGYNRNVTQWSKGEYFLANNTQDDLAVLASKLGYRPDDHGSTLALATPLVLTDLTNVFSTTPESDPMNTNRVNKGVLERNDDVDWFSFVTGSGPIRLAVHPWVMPSGTRGGNLDLWIELYDGFGNRLASNNPAASTFAILEMRLNAGMYFVAVRNSGAGDPWNTSPTGYTPYGSLGQYFWEGWVTDPRGVAVPPVAVLSVADVVELDQTNHLLTVTYSDDVAIQVASLGDDDLLVTGPQGFVQSPRLMSLSTNTNTPRLTATYSLAPPNGDTWTALDNGIYEIWTRPHSVADTEGSWIGAMRLGQFAVSVPVVYYATLMDADPGWTLEPLWQYGIPAYSGVGPTGGATGRHLIGYNLNGLYENNLPMRWATTPAISTLGATSLSLRFQRWLQLRRGDTAQIEVSTNGTHWQAVWSSTGPVADNSWRRVQYDLPESMAGSPTLRIRWGLASNPSQADLGWHLDDVMVVGQGVHDQHPPRPLLRVSDLSFAGAITHSCSVEFVDETRVSLVSLDSQDLWITGPNGYAAWAQFLAADRPMDADRIVATYAIVPPNGSWQPSHNGVYSVTLVEGAVEDVWGHSTPATLLGTFAVRIPIDEPGVLEVWPDQDWWPTATQGGSITSIVTTYLLTNRGAAALRFSVICSEAWLEANPNAGEVGPLGSQNIELKLTDEVIHFMPGIHAATVTFLNLTTGQGNTTRSVRLQVLPAQTHVVHVSAEPPDWGWVEPAGGRFTEGTVVTLYARPALWFAFDTWAGDVRSIANPLTLVVTQDLSVVARFVELKTTNHPTPLWWLASLGYTNEFETVVSNLGANGLPLWQSYVAGLNPWDPASQLRLDIAWDAVGRTVLLAWTPQPGRLYTLWHADAPAGSFQPLPGGIDMDASQNTYRVPLELHRSPRYYKLGVRLP